jgi:hypothetical protein
MKVCVFMKLRFVLHRLILALALEVSTGQPPIPPNYPAHLFSPQQRHKTEILSRYL